MSRENKLDHLARIRANDTIHDAENSTSYFQEIHTLWRRLLERYTESELDALIEDLEEQVDDTEEDE